MQYTSLCAFAKKYDGGADTLPSAPHPRFQNFGPVTVLF